MASYNLQTGAEEVVQQLNELFGSTLNLDIIRSVAESCKFDVEQSSHHLLEITNQHKFQSFASPNSLKMNPSAIYRDNNKSKKAIEAENAIKKINCGYKVLVILRGLPGSGKSTLAKLILQNTVGYNAETAKEHILSADDFFMKRGVYEYNKLQLSEAHGWNHQRAFNVMSRGFSPVIVDNTNSQMWEMKPYATLATDYGYILEILEPDTHWCFNDNELFKRNTHDVPKAKIKSMLERYERNVTPMKLLTAYDCKYKLQKPPQFRLYPPINKETTAPVQFNFNKPHPQSTGKSNIFRGTTSLTSLSGATLEMPPIETINLMDFSEPDVPNTTLQPVRTQERYNNIKTKSQDFETIDNMLMHEEGGISKSTVLKPTLSAKMKQSTSLFDNIQNAWGVDEQALRSWDIVTPLSESTSEHAEIYEIDDCAPITETQDMSTSTDNEYFRMLGKHSPYIPEEGVRILNTCNRDINRNVAVRPQGVKRKLMLDKSCLTDDYLGDQNVHIEHLTHVFPHLPVKTLSYWYNKCNRDFECTLELLLAEQDQLIHNVIDNESVEFNDVPSNVHDPIIIDSDSGSSTANETPILTKDTRKHKRKNNSSSSDESLQLKKCIESKVTISDDHYSEKLLKIKQQRYGQVINESQPSTSSGVRPNTPTYETTAEIDVCKNASDDEEIGWDDENYLDNIETVELNLGEHFVNQLEDQFGDTSLLYPKGFQPVIQVPVALARQLYTFYIESVYQQMDTQNSVLDDLVKEDEEFAKKLQENEEKAVMAATQDNKSQREPMDIPEIMKEQKELSKWQKEADKWKELSPDTIAAKLTKEKLFSLFPSLDRDTLVEILHAHDNVYKDTVDTLLASTNIEDVRGHIDSIKDPPIDESTISEMWEAHESCKVTKDDDIPRSAASYRDDANTFLKKRSDMYEKARRYHQRGMTEVAQFYSGLASQQTKLFEKANGFAATTFLDEHSKRLQDFNTIDLHFLYVKEAIPSLDVFLDTNINLLRLSSIKQIEYLQIITGRGKNSQSGVAKIRPAVISHLKKRNMKFQLLNPGLIRVKITKTSPVTSEL